MDEMRAMSVQEAMTAAMQHHQAGRFRQAEAFYRQVLEQDPANADALHQLGTLAYQEGRHQIAIDLLSRAIGLRPNFARAYYNLGVVLERTGRLDEAIAAYRKATQFQADYAGAYYNLGCVLERKGQLDDAVAAYRMAIQLKPDYAAAHNNLSNGLRRKGRLDEALAACERAIQSQPDFALAHCNKALMLLLKGEYLKGWAEYEWRWRRKGLSEPDSDFSQPAWTGSDPSGRTILLHPEQGFGDTIQFVRYAPLLARRGARVIVECQPELKSLLQTLEGVAQVLSSAERRPAFDVHVPMLGLPLAFGTTVETIPANVSYLRPDPALVKQWRTRLAPRSTLHAPRLKVGLAWAGNPQNPADRDRSLPLSALAPLAEVEGVAFYSLQKGERAAQAKSPPPGMTLVDLAADIKDFADTAALMAHMDLIITVETAVAHLAGALARPVWALLPFVPAWRWLLEREDSPWYPTMRLFRQPAPGDWNSVVQRVAHQLHKLCAYGAESFPPRPREG